MVASRYYIEVLQLLRTLYKLTQLYSCLHYWLDKFIFFSRSTSATLIVKLQLFFSKLLTPLENFNINQHSRYKIVRL